MDGRKVRDDEWGRIGAAEGVLLEAVTISRYELVCRWDYLPNHCEIISEIVYIITSWAFLPPIYSYRV